MKYFMVADPHGFCSILKSTLRENGFFDDKKPHKLIILGDLMDRGSEAVAMQEFVCDCMSHRQLILIRGNHEDLMRDMINGFSKYRMYILHGWGCHHVYNRTFDTALQLTGFSKYEALQNATDFISTLKETPFVKKLIPKSRNYFATENYVFTHGWLPLFSDSKQSVADWQNAGRKEWMSARWKNGMEAAEKLHLTIPEKTIVCGHWHTSYGHYTYEKKGSEFGDDADFSTYYGNGVIGLDACTSHSGKMNCLVIEDKPIGV